MEQQESHAELMTHTTGEADRVIQTVLNRMDQMEERLVKLGPSKAKKQQPKEIAEEE